MKIAHEFTVSATVERAWAVLTDLEGIMPCMPGAALTGRDGETQAPAGAALDPMQYAGGALTRLWHPSRSG